MGPFRETCQNAVTIPAVRKRIGLYAVIILLAGTALLALDGPVMRLVSPLKIGGDLRRELEALQQYGQFSALVLTAVLIWRLQPQRAWRLLDLGLATGLTTLACQAVKHAAGRARPMFGDPWAFIGPMGTFDPGGGRDPVTVWNESYDLASMPSSHTAAAVVLSIFLAALYPRLREFAVVMTSIVGISRVLFGAHYPSDVLAGAVVGLLVGGPIIGTCAGIRLLEKVLGPGRVPGAEAACKVT